MIFSRAWYYLDWLIPLYKQSNVEITFSLKTSTRKGVLIVLERIMFYLETNMEGLVKKIKQALQKQGLALFHFFILEFAIVILTLQS